MAKIQIGKVLIKSNYDSTINFLLEDTEPIYYIEIKKESALNLKKKINNLKKGAGDLIKIGSTSIGIPEKNLIFKETPLGHYILKIDPEKNTATILYDNKYLYTRMNIEKLIENLVFLYNLKGNIIPLHVSAVCDLNTKKAIGLCAWMETGKTYTCTYLYNKYKNILFFGEDRLWLDKSYIYPHFSDILLKNFKIPDVADMILENIPLINKIIYKRYYPKYYHKKLENSNFKIFFIIRNYKKTKIIDTKIDKDILDKFFINIYNEISSFLHQHIRQILFLNPKIFGDSIENLYKNYYTLYKKYLLNKEVTIIEGSKKDFIKYTKKYLENEKNKFT